MAVRVRIEGLRELEKSLAELPKATGKNVLRRIIKARAQPIAEDAETRAPKDTEAMSRSITVGTKLSRRQRALYKKWGSSSAVEMFVGPGPYPQAITQEFGTFDQPAQPFMRPAWDAARGTILDDFAEDLWSEIAKAAARHARKLARQAGG